MQKYWVYKDSDKMRPLIYGDVNKFFEVSLGLSRPLVLLQGDEKILVQLSIWTINS